MAVLTPFHVAIPVRDIAEARRFYGEQMGLPEGRSAPTWIDFNLFGHQFVVHLDPMIGQDGRVRHHFNPVDGHGIPVPHYGVVLRVPDWEELEKRVRTFVTEFVVEPYTRFLGMRWNLRLLQTLISRCSRFKGRHETWKKAGI
jgi:extradiol dioxygenase family protein